MEKLVIDGGFVDYDVNEDEVVIELIEVTEKRKGCGSKLIDMMKGIATDLGLPIGLYAYPQDGSIDEDALKKFYFNNGFDYDIEDCDGRLLAWGK